jgi:hypothetical protein
MKALVTILVCLTLPAAAAEIVLPASALERDSTITALFRTNRQATGKAVLAIRWTDALDRVVEDRKLPVELADENEIRFPLNLRRAAAMANELQVHFTFDGFDKKGAPDHREEDARASFVARPPDRNWSDYAIIMWQPGSAAGFSTMKTLGISAGQYNGRVKTLPEFLIKNDMRWYVENIATDFYSEYHRYRPDRIQQWSYLQAKELYRKDPGGKEAFKRHPSFSDSAWLARIHERLVESARMFSPYRPIFYDLGDESGIADLAAYWDFDFSDQSLAEMRVWLKERYGSLPALNRQWGTSFGSWESVIPDTTNEAMKRPGENFSAWADHKEWMDVSYARALDMGVRAIRSVDPDAYVGIAGAQMPGWGGYDYYKLSHTVTAIEPYDIGNNIEMLRSFNPALPFVTTAFAHGPWEQHRIWYELLHGARGNIIWDEKAEIVSKEGAPGDRGREVAPYYNEIRSGLGALLIQSVREADPIAIHYSQASMRTAWMLAQRPKGDAWINRTSSTERMDSNFLRLRESYCRLIEDLGLQYRFVAYAQVEDGELRNRGYRVLILPDSNSLSDAEVTAIREFSARGGLVIADGEPGVFDEHSRRRSSPALADLSDGTAVRFHALDYHQQRLNGKEAQLHREMKKLLDAREVRPKFAVVDDGGGPVVGIETHPFRNGAVSIVGLLGNPQQRVDELGPPDFKSNERFAKPRTVTLRLPEDLFVYDIRMGAGLGRRRELSVKADPYQPNIFALSPSALPGFTIDAPGSIARGSTALIGIRFSGPSPAAAQVLHVSVTDPAGRVATHYTANVVVTDGAAAHAVPFAVNDAPGDWRISVRDMLSGQERTALMQVN